MNRKFLEDAIADAKTVKESAIANAKVALLESFSPHLTSMLASKLDEMENESVEEDEKAVNLKEKEVKEVKTEDLEELNLEEVLNELENEMDEGAQEIKEEGEDETKDDETDKTGEEDEEIDLEDMSEEDLKTFIEDVIKIMVTDGELEPGESFMDDEENVDLAGVEVEDDTMGGEELTEKKEKEEEVKEVKTDKVSQKELKEAYSVIRTLRGELKEINLLNAKLLYTNKIFKTKALNKTQKNQILEAFDKATTVKEAKLVFETLREGLKSPKKPVRENNIISSASKPTGGVKRSEKQPVVEMTSMVNRFQKLAGIS